MMQYITLAPNFSLAVLRKPGFCFVIKQPLEGVIMHLMYSIVAAESLWKAKKTDQKAEQ